MAALTGATVVGDELGVTLEDVSEEHFGTCDKVVSDKLKTAIIGGHGEEEDIHKLEKQMISDLMLLHKANSLEQSERMKAPIMSWKEAYDL
mgnify:CR=1 FL=1